MKILLPDGWPRPKGYSNGILAEGKLVFVAGQIGWTPDGVFEALDLAGQFARTLDNTLAVLSAAGARPEHIVRMTWYITDKAAYVGALSQIGAIWREKMGRIYPAMAVVVVIALIEDAALIEIETTAVLPH
ncbi:ridA/yjgF/tdcF/rutC subgroup [alpha proteobacterium U9-1i]|nr:ridA/yjgF/tdcF/rutC subgroup [alpha proteobacterium U9-1i]